MYKNGHCPNDFFTALSVIVFKVKHFSTSTRKCCNADVINNQFGDFKYIARCNRNKKYTGE